MKLYTCDICGKMFNPRDPGAVLADRTGVKTKNAYLRPLLDGSDVCPGCVEIGNKLNVRAAVFHAMREKVKDGVSNANVMVPRDR